MDTTCLASGVKQPLKRLLTVNGTGTGHRGQNPCKLHDDDAKTMLRSSKF